MGDLLLCTWMYCHDKVKKNETTFNIIRNTCATPVEKRKKKSLFTLAGFRVCN